jgi:hypothetical protein
MSVVNLVGPYALTQASINQHVSIKSPGVYVLGVTNAANNTFPVDRSGRSDIDLAGRLANHIGKYREFMYAYFNTSREAFYAECELHHAFTPSHNEMHPDNPNGLSLRCPHCRACG